jgi:hypothetical protein
MMEHVTRHGALLGAPNLALAAPFIIKASAETRWQWAKAYPNDDFLTRNLRDCTMEAQGSAGGLPSQTCSNAALRKVSEIKRGIQTGQARGLFPPGFSVKVGADAQGT